MEWMKPERITHHFFLKTMTASSVPRTMNAIKIAKSMLSKMYPNGMISNNFGSPSFNTSH